MKKTLLLALALLTGATCSFAQRRTIEEEKQRFQTLLEWAKTGDVPSRHTAHEEMVKFNQWIDQELLSRLGDATLQERQLFWWVLYDRKCRKALDPAYDMLPAAITRCRESQVAAHKIHELHREKMAAERKNDAATVRRCEDQIAALRPQVQWNEINVGDEINILVSFCVAFGREREFSKLMELAIDSSMDDPLAKGVRSQHWRTYADKPLPAGTDAWNTVYISVWEGLGRLARRPMDKKKTEKMREKFIKHFEALEKKGGLSPNQEAAVKNFLTVRDQMLKTDKNRGDEDGDKPSEKKDDDGETGIIQM